MIHLIRYIFEAALLCFLFLVFKIMPAGMASNVGGWIGRNIGVRLAASRKAYRNLENAMPELSQEQRDVIVRDMWGNLGRIIGEYPHLRYLAKHKTEIVNPERMAGYHDPSNHAIFVSSHSSNWEVNTPAPLLQLDIEIDATYRAPNNPWIYTILKRIRSMGGRIRAYPKSRAGGRALMKAVKEKRNIAFLIDQKYNEGRAVPFFGREAMTNPVYVQLAQKYKLPIIPVQNVRLEGAQFRLIVHEAVDVFDKDGEPRAEDDVMAQVNNIIEGWVREKPGQWLWLHRRWKD